MMLILLKYDMPERWRIWLLAILLSDQVVKIHVLL